MSVVINEFEVIPEPQPANQPAPTVRQEPAPSVAEDICRIVRLQMERLARTRAH
jgi:hypothetical protein